MKNAWQEFLKEIDGARQALKFNPGEECFYRGHADEKYQLLPTLLRHAQKANLSDLDLRSLEANLFFEFQARARELHSQSLSDWDILQFMRHHGVATRFLDWTETFGVALYFAVNDLRKEHKPCIWLLNPYALNEESWDIRDLVAPQYLGGKDNWEYSDFMVDFNDLSFGWKLPVALYPVQKSERLQSQRGYFTIHGDLRDALDKSASKNTYRCVHIPTEAIPDALNFLSLAGINDYAMFPDLDGLARDLHFKNNIC